MPVLLRSRSRHPFPFQGTTINFGDTINPADYPQISAQKWEILESRAGGAYFEIVDDPAVRVRGKSSDKAVETVTITPVVVTAPTGQLACTDCGTTFEKPSGRGRPPKRCPDCRTKE